MLSVFWLALFVYLGHVFLLYLETQTDDVIDADCGQPQFMDVVILLFQP